MKMNPTTHCRQTRFRVTWVALLLVLTVLGAWVCRVGSLALSLRGRALRLQQLAADPKRVSLAALTQDVHGARQELMALRGDLAPLLWLGERLGGDLAVGKPLMDAAVEAVTAGDVALNALAPALGDTSPASFSMSALPRLLDALMAARLTLRDAAAHLDAASATVASVNGSFSPRVKSVVSKADKYLTLAQQGLGAALVAPELLGRDGPRIYLVLVQNSDELRPTGGFISNVGRIVISHGAVISQTFEDSYAVDVFENHAYPNPPQPFTDYMGIDLWVFRDANWSPDFPTSARDAIRLYQIARPERIDGVIGLNQKVVQALILALEPLQIEGMSEPLTAANVEQLFREAWNPGQAGATADWFRTRKQFIGSTARAMMAKALTGQVNWTRLGQGVADMLRQRQVLIYSTGPEAPDLARLNWDGALRQTEPYSDYLMVVDSNLGYGKANLLVDQRVDYRVMLRADGTGRAAVTLDYVHRGTQPGIVCSQFLPYDASVTYDKVIQRCYYDYVRLIVPPGSHLRAATAHPVPGAYFINGKPADGEARAVPDEGGKSMLAQFFVVEYGQQLQTRIEYDLPVVVTTQAGRQQYMLTLQKQSGTGALPVKMTLDLPPGARVLPEGVHPQPTRQTGASLEFDLALDQDRQIKVEFMQSR
jgi:hypothetical protein